MKANSARCRVERMWRKDNLRIREIEAMESTVLPIQWLSLFTSSRFCYATGKPPAGKSKSTLPISALLPNAGQRPTTLPSLVAAIPLPVAAAAAAAEASLHGTSYHSRRATARNIWTASFFLSLHPQLCYPAARRPAPSTFGGASLRIAMAIWNSILQTTTGVER